jgi:hypothetical protein
MPNQLDVSITENQVNVTQGVTRIVTVTSQGPQGPIGPIPNTGSFALTGSNEFVGDQTITGSLTVSGSSTFTNIGPAVFSGSLEVTGGITGSIGPSFDLTPIMKYIDTRVEHESSNIISSTTVRFNEARFATAPIGFPPPRKYDFQYYINGVLIPHSNVISIIQTSISVIEIVFDTSLLGYTLESGDIVSVIGKFNSSAFSSGFSNGFSSHAYSFVLQSKTLIFNPNI